MNIELTEVATLAGIVVTIGSIAMGSYIGVVKANVSVKKDLDSAFNGLRDIKDINTSINERLDKKASRLESMEKMLYEYLKKHEAEEMFARKDIILPIIDNIKHNQETLHCEVKDFRDDVIKSLDKVTETFNFQSQKNIEFQHELLLAIKKEGCKSV
jgi:hypothetical protein